MPDLGDIATATLTVSPFGGTTSATLVVTAPDGTTTSPTPTTADGGATWTATITYSQAGWYLLKWTVTGTGAGVQYQQVHVAGAPLVPLTTPLVATLEEFKGWLKYGTSNADDERMLVALTSATEWVQWRISGPITVTTFTERIYANGEYLKQRKHPLVAVVSVTPQDGTALSSTSYLADTTNSMIYLRFGGYGWYTVVYTAGPARLRKGAQLGGLEVARHLWGILNGSAGRGFQADEMIQTPFGFAIPNRAEELLGADPDTKTMPGFA